MAMLTGWGVTAIEAPIRVKHEVSIYFTEIFPALKNVKHLVMQVPGKSHKIFFHNVA